MKICNKCTRDSYVYNYLIPTGYTKGQERTYTTIHICLFCSHDILQEFFHQMWPTQGENWLEDSGIGIKE